MKMQLLVSACCALTPLAWLARGRRSRKEGKRDGLLLLASLVCAGIGLVLCVVAATRQRAEDHRLAASHAVDARVESCHVIDQRTSGRDALRSHELQCEVRLSQDETLATRTVTAGYPTSRAAFDRFVAEHPRGSIVSLRQPVDARLPLWGLELLVPSTTTAAYSGGQALIAGIAAVLLLAVSRLVAHRAD